jgi:hypothetical protein
MKTKGLMVNVYVHKPYLDCSANGISTKNDRLILIEVGTDNIPAIFDGDENNTVKLVRKDTVDSEEYLCCVPITKRPENSNGPMFGGNFIYSSDSRFPSKYPIPIHDRYESIV